MPGQLPVPTRKIGNDNVTAIGYGAMGISSYYAKPQSDEERIKVRPIELRNFKLLI